MKLHMKNTTNIRNTGRIGHARNVRNTIQKTEGGDIMTEDILDKTLIRLTNVTTAIFYILGGKALITISHHNPEKHLTYRIVRSKNHLSTYFVRVKTQAGYKYVGVLHHDIWRPWYTSVFSRTPKSEILDTDLRYKAFYWFWANLFGRSTIPDSVDILRHRICCVCGAKLTHPKSIKAGIGPMCTKRHPLANVFKETI